MQNEFKYYFITEIRRASDYRQLRANTVNLVISEAHGVFVPFPSNDHARAVNTRLITHKSTEASIPIKFFYCILARVAFCLMAVIAQIVDLTTVCFWDWITIFLKIRFPKILFIKLSLPELVFKFFITNYRFRSIIDGKPSGQSSSPVMTRIISVSNIVNN